MDEPPQTQPPGEMERACAEEIESTPSCELLGRDKVAFYAAIIARHTAPQRTENERLRAQRDELLAACKKGYAMVVSPAIASQEGLTMRGAQSALGRAIAHAEAGPGEAT